MHAITHSRGGNRRPSSLSSLTEAAAPTHARRATTEAPGPRTDESHSNTGGHETLRESLSQPYEKGVGGCAGESGAARVQEAWAWE